MSGHSKWANIQHRKGRQDAKRGKEFTKAAKEIIIAAKNGGDPASNSRLRAAIAAAKSINLPKDKIEAAIRKGTGQDAGGDIIEINYEGYGPGGVAVIVETATDNRNRTGADMRHYFDKYGGSLGQTGCVSYMFEDKGVIVIDAEDIDEEKIMEDALEAGAEDISNEGDVFEITTAPNDLSAVTEALTEKGYKFISCEQSKIPANYVTLTGEDELKNMNKLIEMLEENDDVTKFWHNSEV